MFNFTPPDFNMGMDNNLIRSILRRKRNDQINQENQQNAEQGLLGFNRQREMSRMSQVMNPVRSDDLPVFGTAGINSPKGNIYQERNPSLQEYRRGQLELGRERIEAGREKEAGRLDVAERNVAVRERLAALKDLTESERIQLLQDGKIDLAEYNAAQDMARVNRQGEIRSGQIEQQGKITSGQIDQRGRIESGHIAERGGQAMALEKARQLGRITLQELNSLSAQELEQLRQEGRIQVIGAQGEQARQTAITRAQEARKTKAAPSSSTNSQLPTQQKVVLQSKAIQFANRNPELGSFITFNEQGFPVISNSAPPEIQMRIYQDLYGESRDTNLPLETPPTTQNNSIVTQPTVTQPQVTQPTPGKVQVPQLTEEFRPDNNPQPQMIEMITPDGKGTRLVPKDKIPIALSQGYKQKGQ